MLFLCYNIFSKLTMEPMSMAEGENAMKEKNSSKLPSNNS